MWKLKRQQEQASEMPVVSVFFVWLRFVDIFHNRTFPNGHQSVHALARQLVSCAIQLRSRGYIVGNPKEINAFISHLFFRETSIL